MARALGSKHETFNGAYTYRWVIGKATGDGEQTSVEVIANIGELKDKVNEAYDLLDKRMFLQNERYQTFMKLTKELPPELMIKVRQCNDLTFGRISLDQIMTLAPKEEPESGEAQG